LENPCKIVCFGDSITKAWAPLLEVALRNKFPDHQIDIVNLGVVSDTTAGAVRRLHSVLAERPDVVLIGFGMNDWRKDIDREKFRSNLSFLAEKLVAQSIRTVFLTINPGGRVFGEIAPEIVEYNENVMAIAKQCCCRVVDVFSAFTEKVFPVSKGLYDEIHPNELGDRVITEELLDIVPLDQTVIVWTFNGEHCFCNYECPYCYVPSEVNMGHAYPGAPEKWHEALKRSFGNQKLVFYFSFGEPMGGKGFYELIEMIGEEQRWGCHITTNLSLPLGRLLKTKLVRENRLHVNASFHPTQTSIVSFLERLLILRQHGIEPSIVYVMYPPQLAEFADYFEVFRQHGLFVHVRRFRGIYDGRPYPQSYTEEERRFVARYCDTLTVKYMLNDMEDKPEETASKLSYWKHPTRRLRPRAEAHAFRWNSSRIREHHCRFERDGNAPARRKPHVVLCPTGWVFQKWRWKCALPIRTCGLPGRTPSEDSRLASDGQLTMNTNLGKTKGRPKKLNQFGHRESKRILESPHALEARE